MLFEPSVLLIDDDASHYNILCKMNLDKEDKSWVVEGAIDKTIQGAYKKAYDMIVKYQGFTVILLDIMWKYDKDNFDSYAGIKILQKLYKTVPASPICRQVMTVTRATSTIAPDNLLNELRKLTTIMQLPYIFETQFGQNGIKKCLLDFWQQIRPKK